MSPILASDFTGLFEFLIGIAVVLLLGALTSFLPARRGHWSAVLIALPVFVVGSYLFVSIIQSGPAPILADLFFAAPPLLALISLGVWICTLFGSRKARRSGGKNA